MTVFCLEIREQVDLDLGAGREVGVPAFAGPDAVFFTIPVKPGLSQPGAGGHDAAVADGLGKSGLQGLKLGVAERGDARAGLAERIGYDCGRFAEGGAGFGGRVTGRVHLRREFLVDAAHLLGGLHGRCSLPGLLAAETPEDRARLRKLCTKR